MVHRRHHDSDPLPTIAADSRATPPGGRTGRPSRRSQPPRPPASRRSPGARRGRSEGPPGREHGRRPRRPRCSVPVAARGAEGASSISGLSTTTSPVFLTRNSLPTCIGIRNPTESFFTFPPSGLMCQPASIILQHAKLLPRRAERIASPTHSRQVRPSASSILENCEPRELETVERDWRTARGLRCRDSHVSSVRMACRPAVCLAPSANTLLLY